MLAVFGKIWYIDKIKSINKRGFGMSEIGVENKDGVRALVTGSIIQLFLGIIYVWSVFVIPVSEFFTWAVDSVKLTSSFMLCFFVLGILVGGKLQMKTGTAKVVLAGGLLMALGMFATSLISSNMPWLIYITYGIVGGFGVGMAYNANISCAQKWFPQKRGLATGISVCAFGFSTVIFAPLVEVLLNRFGLVNAFRILAVLFFVVVICLYRFVKLPQDSQTGGAASADLLMRKQYNTSEMLKTKEFFYITLSLMLGTTAYFILNPSFKTLAIDRGLAPNIGTVIVMLTGIANALGRLAVPSLSDKIGREKTALIIFLATAVCTAALCFASGGLFMVAIAVIAFCYGGYSGIYPLITADYFGIKNVGSNYGAIMVGFALSALLAPMFMNLVQNVILKFIILTVLVILGALMIIILSRSKERSDKA